MERGKRKLAITGRSGTGKSTFINTIGNVKPGDDSFAKTGSGNTTLLPTLYMHPKNDQIAFYDLPGHSTIQFKKEDYISAMKISDYDFVFIFFDKVLSEDDLWLAGELRKMGKPFALVRSMIDNDIVRAIRDDKDPEKIIPEIKEKIEIDLYSNTDLKSTTGIFLISSEKPHLGDWSKLMVFLEVNMDGFKAEALLFSLHCITKEMLERKYQMLKNRIVVTTATAASVAAIPLPIVDVAINTEILVHEVCHYMRVFGIEPESVNTLENFDHSLLKCKSLFKPNVDMAVWIASKIGILVAMIVGTSFLDVVLPIIGSVISSALAARVTYKFLNDTLRDIKDDAELIYEHKMYTNADHRL